MLRRIAFESGVVLALTSTLLFLAATSETEFTDVGARHVVPRRGMPRPYLSWHELTSRQ